MSTPRLRSALFLGMAVGLVFGAANLVFTWLDPLADDTPAALLRFYGPMFFVWALASFRAVRHTGRLISGVVTGLSVAFGTFLIFELLIFVRLNLFLNELTGRADWKDLVTRSLAANGDGLRSFVNLDYVRGAPLKAVVSCVIGAIMGSVGGLLGHLTRRRTLPTANGR
jgi:hypothetical protein